MTAVLTTAEAQEAIGPQGSTVDATVLARWNSAVGTVCEGEVGEAIVTRTVATVDAATDATTFTLEASVADYVLWGPGPLIKVGDVVAVDGNRRYVTDVDLTDKTFTVDGAAITVAGGAAVTVGTYLVAEVPDAWKEAASIILRTNWSMEQGHRSDTYGPPEVSGFLIPTRALQLLQGVARLGIA